MLVKHKLEIVWSDRHASLVSMAQELYIEETNRLEPLEEGWIYLQRRSMYGCQIS